ncbi:Ephrin type-A receptor 6 [Camelus dromedarius]|uniref:Ephrin type-A receptor 6 n=1 Tax=Camelus dromedarius TaxID=9838 RepID=A0A5N4EK98_CAMDR|nr:Ephrin type-A receptor 6 [Camelus dromedarius]
MVKKTQREYTECRDTGKEFNPLEHQDLRNEEVSPKETEKEEADGEVNGLHSQCPSTELSDCSMAVEAGRMPESPGEVPEYPLFVTVGDWLDSIKMGQYKNNFMAAGFTTFDLISRMSIE